MSQQPPEINTKTLAETNNFHRLERRRTRW